VDVIDDKLEAIERQACHPFGTKTIVAGGPAGPSRPTLGYSGEIASFEDKHIREMQATCHCRGNAGHHITVSGQTITKRKSRLETPHSGHVQSFGMSAKRVPGGQPSSGSPTASL
jgi:hypothetical protein